MRPPHLASVDGSEADESHFVLQRSWSADVALAPFGLLEPPSSLPATPLLQHTAPRPDMKPPSPLGDMQKPLMGEEYTPETPKTSWWWRLLAFTGPGWLMSIAYVDPGNLEADLQCGAQYGYGLLWVLSGATLVGLGMQLVAARLGCATHRHLAEHCREHYSPRVRLLLWVLTETAIIGSDIQEVIGCSIGLQLLLGLPLSVGVVVTAVAAFGFLYLERFGTRPLELFFGMLIMILAVSMGGLYFTIQPDQAQVLEGLVVPRLPPSAVQQAVSMIGCIIMPHNLFLHSALVQSRVVSEGEEGEAITFFNIESSAAIFTSILINTFVVAVFAKGFHGTVHQDDIGLKNAGQFLGEKFGDPMRVIWALGLCAAGQSSTMTGAYAGQWIMQGYLDLKVKPWKRALITRSMALTPCLFVAIYFGDHEGLDDLNSYLNVWQSLMLPFAAVPLLTFAGARSIMGALVLSPAVKALAWLATTIVMMANTYLFIEQFGGVISVGLVTAVVVYISAIAFVAVTPKIEKPAT